jgi:hypothetical protein
VAPLPRCHQAIDAPAIIAFERGRLRGYCGTPAQSAANGFRIGTSDSSSESQVRSSSHSSSLNEHDQSSDVDASESLGDSGESPGDETRITADSAVIQIVIVPTCRAAVSQSPWPVIAGSIAISGPQLNPPRRHPTGKRRDKFLFDHATETASIAGTVEARLSPKASRHEPCDHRRHIKIAPKVVSPTKPIQPPSAPK